MQELIAALEVGKSLPDLSERIPLRQAERQRYLKVSPPAMLPEKSSLSALVPWHRASNDPSNLHGIGTSAGQVTAPACVLFGPEDFPRMRPGDVLVAVTTTPAWTPCLPNSRPTAHASGMSASRTSTSRTLRPGKITQITTDGGGNIINGTFDWVYEEELDCRDGFRWSPDGKTIAYWQSDTKNIGTFYLIDNVSDIYSKPIPLPYPKVGTKLSAVKIGVIPATGGKTKWFDMPGDPTNNYIARMDFIPNSNELMIQQLNRLQNTNKVWIGDAAKLSLNNILTETDSAFLDIHDNIRWLDGEKYFTWTSERDGWRHLYRVSRDGKEIKPITKGDFDVVNINCIDPAGGYVYYIASPDSFIERYLYRSRLDGTRQSRTRDARQTRWGIIRIKCRRTPSGRSTLTTTRLRRTGYRSCTFPITRKQS